MKTTVEHREIMTGGVEKSVKFTILANGKAFKTLIDGLYSDKIRAVIRELWTNAYDSHCEAGISDLPFHCQLPNILEPHFRVRDYGVSLTDEGVMHLYTTVFESTKTDTNNQVGKLGLGSKSPFAYTDSFGVIAFLNGEKRTYSAYIGEDGVPEIVRFSTEETDELDGLEVSFPVKSTDCRNFSNTARAVGAGFDVKPDITGATDVFGQAREVSLRGDGWILFASTNYGTGTGAFAKQGCVLYPITTDSIPDLTKSQRELCNSPLQINFPIGSLEISASREALGYDSETIKNIKERLAVVEKEITAQFQSKLDSATTLWEARCQFKLLLDDRSIPYALKSVLQENMTWEGKTLRILMTVGYRDSRLRHMIPFKDMAVDVVDNRRLRNKTLRWTETRTWSLPCVHNTLFIRDDKDVSVVASRLLYAFQSSPQGERPRNIVWIKPKTQKAFVRMMKWLGHPPIINASQLERPPHLVGARTRVSVPIKRFTGSTYNSWSDITHIISDGGVYVDLLSGEAQTKERGDLYARHIYNADIRKLKNLAIKFGIIKDDTVIYGLPGTYKSIPKKNPAWVSFFDLIHDYLDKHLNDKSSKFLRRIKYLNTQDLTSFSLELDEGDLDIHDKGSPIVKYINLAKKTNKPDVTKYSKVETMAELVNRRPNVTVDVQDIDDLISEVKNKYIFISTFLNLYVTLVPELMKELNWYINHIDAQTLTQED